MGGEDNQTKGEGKPAQKRRLFGTDGIRGQANHHPMSPELVLKLGRAAGIVFRRGSHRHRIVIGKDTRLSGYMFESSLRAGFLSMGIQCLQVGSLPTPAVAFLTRALRADAGVMISASHNPYFDNGIKFFDSNGMKLPDETELEIERLVLEEGNLEAHQPDSASLGKAVNIEDARGRYIEFCKNAFSRKLRLDGLRVVLDCAHGAAYKVAPIVLWELGAEVITIGCDPNGININEGFGSLHPRQMQAKVREVRADVGIAFDGDADRLVVCDEQGELLDGDHILAICAANMQRHNTLRGGGVVATVMSNLGLERFLRRLNLNLVRTQVGDRHVLEHMYKNGFNLGGEQSGHIIFTDHNTTGDGLISALKVLELLAAGQKPLSELTADMQTVPQVLRNVRIQPGVDPLADPQVQKHIEAAERELGETGRLLIRKSGTEPKVRVMVEGDSLPQVEKLVEDLCRSIRKAADVA
ncbi:MAG: phosphoglucosamine mutase [Magnetococcales bacterium]|nr:phosphoglucosamine mutase [Magnetococcales bacterium]